MIFYITIDKPLPSVLTAPPIQTSPRRSQCHIVDTATTDDKPTNVTDSLENTITEPKVPTGTCTCVLTVL